jgi:hypothetical protein
VDNLRPRTAEEEYRKLYEGAWFRLTRTVPTRAEVGVIEGEEQQSTETHDEALLDATAFGDIALGSGACQGAK